MKSRDEETLAAAGAGCILALLSIPISIGLKLFVGSKFWEWFILPTFNIPMPSAAMGYGLMLVISLWCVKTNYQDAERTTLQSGLYAFCSLILVPLISLLLGYVAVYLVRHGY